MIYTYNTILFGLKKEGNSDTSYATTYTNVFKFIDRKLNNDFQGLRARGNGEFMFNGYRVLVGKMKRVLEMDDSNACIKM